jgi:nicotinate-nucleotide pyrophosphorylase (carboxylating)
MVQHSLSLPADIGNTVARALEEDQGDGDLTAGLIAEDATAKAQVTAGTEAVLSGCAWFDEVFRQLDERVVVNWNTTDGTGLSPKQLICEIAGPARPILTGERAALNFLQTLSGTATAARDYVTAIAGTTAQLLDTRKTIPGLRLAQKYAVCCGGGKNHRMGLHDAVLIKENHITAAGGIGPAARSARRTAPEALIEIEAETLAQVHEALSADIDRILLDNFSIGSLKAAVAARDALDGRRIELEASGGIEIGNIRTFADTGVDFVSIGAITKNVTAIDFSMRFL